eukprot:1195530-Prorocentrum_minimum.AAC.5
MEMDPNHGEFEVRTLTSDGAELLIRPLRKEDVDALSFLLATTFADAEGIVSYRCVYPLCVVFTDESFRAGYHPKALFRD